MTEFQEVLGRDDQPVQSSAESEDQGHEEPVNGTAQPAVAMEAAQPDSGSNGTEDAGTWHAEAGRKGALRRRDLIRAGLLYEKEHGLKRGRQRIRQLIQEGRLYEEEHGLRPARKKRLPRLSSQQALRSFFQSLLRIAKPSLRADLARMMQALDEAK